ncbi:MAG: 2-iminoacetate synthase ThiH [Verrucomicrobia bacterium]|nr:2-iminoacetate synthase ThiH [Verrucomicrobiota bacterium]
MSFADVHAAHPWDDVLASVQAKTDADVLRSLARAENGITELEDFKAFISPAAAPHLETLARLSRERTLRRFGRTMQLFAPAYLSNECQNVCTYCGFSAGNKVARRTLNPGEILREAGALKKLGFDHLLLLTGESNKIEVPYFVAALDLLRPHFASLSMEVQPLETAEYAELRRHGLNAVLVYQETYHRETYNTHHPKGRKSDFAYRLDAPDRVGAAGVHKIGLGALFGLEDWRAECFFTALHLQWLERKHWQSRFSVSFPRIRPHEGELQPKVEMTDRDLVQAICAFRLFNGEIELTLSTRESETFRNHACRLGITAMSAGSRTNPGGYAEGKEASLEQFAIEDDRSPAEVAAMLKAAGYETVWKDWDPSYDQPLALSR